MSLNIVCRWIKKCNLKLYYAKRRMEKTIQTVTNEKCKNSLCDGMRVHQYMWSYHSRLMLEFWRDMLPSRLWLFPGNPCLFQQDNARPHSARATTARLCRIELRVRLTGLPAVQICLLLKMYGASWRGESDNGDHRLLSSSSVYTPWMGKNVHLQNCNNAFSSQRLQS